jgi:hypothetical protein
MLRQHDRLADRVLRGHISLPGAGDSTIFKHPHRRVRPFGTKDRRHDRVICVRAHEALLVLGARQALDARKQPGADADSLGTEHERGRGRPAIRDSTCRDNRRSVHRIYYRRYKRHRAEIGLHVPACFLRLNNNCICAERLEPPRALHRVSRSPYLDPGAFQLPHPTLLRWIPEEDRERDVLRYGDLDMGFRRCRTEASLFDDKVNTKRC